ncbi:MAG: hypothetical protein QM775_18005 [Pirellulales bacterium]
MSAAAAPPARFNVPALTIVGADVGDVRAAERQNARAVLHEGQVPGRSCAAEIAGVGGGRLLVYGEGGNRGVAAANDTRSGEFHDGLRRSSGDVSELHDAAGHDERRRRREPIVRTAA